MGSCRRKTRKIEVHMVADEIIERRAGALVGNMSKIFVKLKFEQFTCEMAWRADPGGREGHFRLRFQRCQELRHCAIRRLGRNNERERHDCRKRNRHEVLVRVVVEALEPMLVDRHFAGLTDQQRVAIWGGGSYRVSPNSAAGTSAILDDNRLP